MTYDPIATARSIAHRAHAEQERRPGVPFVVHPARVAHLVSESWTGMRTDTADPSLVAAAWLHDVLEDTLTTRADLLGWYEPPKGGAA